MTGTSSTHTDHDATIVASAGTLTIGGVAVTLTGDVTLDGLADAINSTPNIGVSASVVQNGSNFQLVLTGQQTGAANSFAITNGLSGGAGVAFSATNAQDASNAEGTVNGIAFSTPSNTIDGVIPQSTLELSKTAAPTNPIVVTITGDRSSVKELINKVRLAYNEVVAFIDDQQLAAKEKNPASIGRDPLVRDLRSQLARVLNTERTVPGVVHRHLAGRPRLHPDRSARVQRGGVRRGARSRRHRRPEPVPRLGRRDRRLQRPVRRRSPPTRPPAASCRRPRRG